MGKREQHRIALEADAGKAHDLGLGLDARYSRLLQELEPDGQAVAGMADDLIEQKRTQVDRDGR